MPFYVCTKALMNISEGVAALPEHAAPATMAMPTPLRQAF